METVLILCAAFGAGVLNTIAGGGTFLTFPALVFIGIPPVMANATSAVAVFPGYLGGAIGFRDEVACIDRSWLARLLGGSLLMLASSNKAFSAVVLFLHLATTRTKTDRIDAELITRFMVFRPEVEREVPCKNLRTLRTLTTQRGQLSDMRKRLKTRIGARKKPACFCLG